MGNNIRKMIMPYLFIGVLCVSLWSCFSGSHNESSTISSVIISPSTEESCLNMESGSACNLQLNINNNSNTDLSMSYTMNASGIAQPLPNGYIVNSLSQCVAQINNKSSSTCFVNVEYSGGSPGIGVNLYFMLCNGLCSSPGNPIAITSVPINLNAVE